MILDDSDHPINGLNALLKDKNNVNALELDILKYLFLNKYKIN